MNALELLVALICAHFICDYPLQGDFLSKAKSRWAPVPGVPWYQAMVAHAAIHGAAVWLLTTIWWLGLAEAVAHALIDDQKCRGRLTFNQDQMAHGFCKVVWLMTAILLPGNLPR